MLSSFKGTIPLCELHDMASCLGTARLSHAMYLYGCSTLALSLRLVMRCVVSLFSHPFVLSKTVQRMQKGMKSVEYARICGLY